MVLDVYDSNNYTIRFDTKNQIFTTALVSKNNPHHICIVLNADVNGTKIYLDNALIKEGTASLVSSYTTAPFIIGAAYYTNMPASYGHFNGLIDNFRIYSRDLDTNEIRYLYENHL